MKKTTAPRFTPPVAIPFIPGREIALLAPNLSSHHSLEACLLARRSRRDYSAAPISLDETAQLLWAAQGVTGLGGLRTAPSAGALYPLRTYLIAGNIETLPAGIYRYQPDSHTLKTVALGDRRDRLALAAMNQQCAREAALAVLFAANYFQSSREFGAAAPRLALIEAGHAAQNFCLQATCLDLGVITLGKFDADLLREALDLPAKEDPLYLVVAGRK